MPGSEEDPYSQIFSSLKHPTRRFLLRSLKEHFGPRVFRTYGGHEENQVTNMTGTAILARWVHSSPGHYELVAAYIHRYINGMVLHIGVMSSDEVSSDQSVQFFLIESIFEPD